MDLYEQRVFVESAALGKIKTAKQSRHIILTLLNERIYCPPPEITISFFWSTQI